MSNVIDTIVRFDLCVGCGVCVSICPDNNLGIRMNDYGEYIPYFRQKCLNECSKCYKVCPFGNGNQNEDEIGYKLFGSCPNVQHDPATGFFLKSFSGHVISEIRRESSASGGLITWLLTSLLRKNQIDAAICVSPTNEPNTLFKYSVIRDIKDIESSSGSAYYPVQLSDAISYIQVTPGRYAITALPCFAKAIRLAQVKNKILRDRIVCIIGITCGQMKSKYYTEYLGKLTGVKGKISKAHYRGKERGQPSNNYFFSCESVDGENGKIFWNDGMSEVWSSRWFTLNSCNYCDDIFAECADIVCMDAWLPEYIADWRGTSLLLVRSSSILEQVRDGIDNGYLIAAPIQIDEIKQSQRGLIDFKRQELMTRLWVDEKEGIKVLEKRFSPKRNFNQILVMKSQILRDIQIMSKERYHQWLDEKVFDLAHFQRELEPYQRRLRILSRGTAIYLYIQDVRKRIRQGCP